MVISIWKSQVIQSFNNRFWLSVATILVFGVLELGTSLFRGWRLGQVPFVDYG